MVVSDASTRVFLADYWGDTYGIVGPAFEATLFDESGRVVDAWSIELEADSTVVVDIRERCTSAGVPLPFSGQLLLRLRDERLVPGRPVQVFAEYGDASGGVSGVHGQYGLMTVPAAQVLCAMRAEGEEGMRTGVVVMNPYVGPGSPHPMRTTMTLVADDGRHVSHQLDPVDPMTSRTVYIDEVFPGSAELLGGRTGHLRLSVPCPSSRVATFVTFPDGRRVVNHGTIDRVFDQLGGVPVSWTDSWPLVSCFAIVDQHRDTHLSLPNVWGPERVDRTVRVSLYRADGTPVSLSTVQVPADGLRTVSVRGLLEEAGAPSELSGHAELRIEPGAGGRQSPATFDVLSPPGRPVG